MPFVKGNCQFFIGYLPLTLRQFKKLNITPVFVFPDLIFALAHLR